MLLIHNYRHLNQLSLDILLYYASHFCDQPGGDLHILTPASKLSSGWHSKLPSQTGVTDLMLLRS
ncbi:hypothetical protein AEST_06200 [Alishewanella aestuarii B11]|jgi:hypothetical protein|uniref:Uncharacterized protein n=1 Tax=Alishewanella aestuarii B11 TaxID=1197174 RepID=J2IHP0_9ALTE|nr:hypothetical protein AEST_06200 [Alishewanella aestuarii B11]